MFLLGLCGFAYAQNIQIKGTVKYATDGEPIIGASVVQTGTTNGTITDFNGNFSLNVTSGTELTVSYIGFKTVKVKAQPNLKITLEEDAQLIDEVVVTGYTTQRKADLTGAVSVVKVDELKKVPENNPMRALQGKVAGMMVTADGNPGGKATIRIRGVGTLNNNDPLYIIDGVPTKAGMHELNSSDIESIQVLKDASSASIYGSRAANGVIIITTKQGKEGKIRVDLNAGLTTSWYSSKMDMLNTVLRTGRLRLPNFLPKSQNRSRLDAICQPQGCEPPFAGELILQPWGCVNFCDVHFKNVEKPRRNLLYLCF